MSILNNYLTAEQNAELNYYLTGDGESFCREKLRLRQEFAKEVSGDVFSSIPKTKYNDALRYVGDSDLKNRIEQMEKEFRPIRKTVEKSEYENRLRTLVSLRNRFARSAGVDSYLEYQYRLWGIDEEATRKVADLYRGKEADSPSRLLETVRKWKTEPLLQKENQTALLDQVLEHFNLQLPKGSVVIHTTNLPQFYIGACISVSIPDESHVMMNQVSGLGGFSIFLHEVGHAYYYSHIKADGESGRPYDLVVEELVALTFEALAYSPEFFRTFLGSEENVLSDKLKYQLNYLSCCTVFEELIYSTEDADYDEEWGKLCRIFAVDPQQSWRDPHFFVSNPGYFAADLLASYLTKCVYEYVEREKLDLAVFLRETICEPGADLDYAGLLGKLDPMLG